MTNSEPRGPDPDGPPAATADEQGGRPAAPQPGSSITLDARALRVLAHPLRSRLVTALRVGGPATATALAASLDTNTGATSYHLRKLAEVGLVTETGEGRGRERWWRASTQMHSWTERAVAADPDARAASDWLRRSYFRSFAERYESWLDEQSSWSVEWRDAAGANDYFVTVGADRLDRLNADLRDVLDRYREPAPDDTDAIPIIVNIHSMPMRYPS